MRTPAPSGFTLIEVIIVVTILGIVLAVAIPAYERYIERSRVVEAIVQVGDMSRGIRAHEVAKGALPDSLAEVTYNGINYAGKADPWGYPYEYFNLVNSKGNGQARKDKKLAPLNSDFDLYSIGRDGQTAASLGNARSRDDIVRARDGGFVGTAEEFDP